MLCNRTIYLIFWQKIKFRLSKRGKMEKEGVGGREMLRQCVNFKQCLICDFFFFQTYFNLTLSLPFHQKTKKGNISLKRGKMAQNYGFELSLPFQLVLISRNNNCKTPKFRVKILTEEFWLHAAYGL